MKAIYINKKFLLKIALVCVVLCLCVGLTTLGDSLVTAVFEESALQGVTSSGNPDSNSVSFMVLVDDEGAKEYIPKMLQIFADNKVKASFFVTGKWAEDNKDMLKSILARGHEIGNYGYDATSPANLTLEENQEAISKTDYLIKKNLGLTPTLFVSHFGVIEDDVKTAAKSNGKTFVLASVDSMDWGETSPEKIISSVLYYAKSGSFISLHPCKNTVDAMQTMLLELSAKGLGYKTVSDNLK